MNECERSAGDARTEWTAKNVRAMCYVSSTRGLLVACVSDGRELTTIKAYSHSRKKGLEFKSAVGNMCSRVFKTDCVERLLIFRTNVWILSYDHYRTVTSGGRHRGPCPPPPVRVLCVVPPSRVGGSSLCLSN